MEIKERLEHEHEVATRASRARKATTSLEKDARDGRLSRINKDRETIGKVWEGSFVKIDQVHKEIKGLTDLAEKMSRQYLIDNDIAAQRDRKALASKNN